MYPLEMKLQIWENQLRTCDTFHFPTLTSHYKEPGYVIYCDELKDLKKRKRTDHQI